MNAAKVRQDANGCGGEASRNVGRRTKSPSERLTDIVYTRLRGHVLLHTGEHVHLLVRIEEVSVQFGVVGYEDARVELAGVEVLPCVVE